MLARKILSTKTCCVPNYFALQLRRDKSSQKTLKISRKELPRAHTGTPGTRAQGQWQAGSQAVRAAQRWPHSVGWLCAQALVRRASRTSLLQRSAAQRQVCRLVTCPARLI